MPSYSDILFGKIVVKNGLAPLPAVQECLQIQETSRARGVVMSLPEIMVARAAITEEQARLASRAQALTQLQRAESIYAKIVHERSLVPFKVLQDCFAEQKAKRFTVRISQLLLERRLLTAEQNDEVMEEQLVRLGEETRQQEEAGVSGSTTLMEDSKIQKLQAEQARLQDLQASTFRNASMRGLGMPGSSTGSSTGANAAVTRAQVAGSRPPTPPAPRPVPKPSPPQRPPVPDTAAEVQASDPGRANLGHTMELDVPTVFPGMAPTPVAVDDLRNWGSNAPSSKSRENAARPKAAEKAGEPKIQSDPGSLLGKTISSRYRILDKIGEGGMGTVYKAEHCLMEKIVAFKVLHPHLIANKQSLERFRREVRAASKFQHKNVIQIYDAGEGEGGIFYMAMEFVEGESLEAILQKGPMPFERTCVILRQVLKALGEAHKKGIVHRDMKSDNIMIAKDKRGEDLVKVMDFGIAKVLEGADSNAESQGGDGERVYKTMEGVITGTPQYMSPEQAEGKKVDHRADLYSLGIIMFEMVTGQLPFQSETAMGYLGKHIVEEPPLPSSVMKDGRTVPPAFEKIVMRLLEKEPDKRYQSAGEIFDEFEANVTNQFLEVRPGMGSVSGEEVKPKGVVEKRPPGGLPVALIAVFGAAFVVIAIGLLVVGVVVMKKPGKDEIVATALRDADALKAKGETKKALDVLRAALVAAPNDPRLTDAVKSFGGDVADPRAQADGLVKEADAAAAVGDKPSLEKAVDRLEKAAALVPDDAAIKARLEKARGELKRLSEAPKPTLKDLLAEAARARQAGEADKAKTAFEAARALSPDDPEVKVEGRRRDADAEHALALATKDPAAAKPHFVEAIKLEPDEDVSARWQKELDGLSAPTVPPPPPPPADPAAEARAKTDAALDRARDALVALDLETAKAALDEAGASVAKAGTESQRRFDLRKGALAALQDLRTKLDATRAELTAMSQKISDASEKRLAAARAQLDENAKALAALADTEVAKGLEPRIQQDRNLADQVRDALPKPGAQNEEALKRWREVVRRFKDEQLPELERKRDGEKLLSQLDGLRSNPAFSHATADEQSWVRSSLASYSARAKVWSKIPARYVSIRGGAYTLARGSGGKPPESFTLTDYAIDSNECTMEDWAIYLEATSDQDPPPRKPDGFRGRTDDPLTNVSAEDVRLYAAWLTKKADNLVTFRLPTEAEWERAARGKAGLDFPWGPGFRPDRDEGRLALGKIVRVRSFDPNDLEIYDMAGNAAELTATLVGGKRVVKGGSSSPEQAAASARELVDKDEKNRQTGFRLVAVETPAKR